MPPRPKLAAFRGPITERFAGITWDEANRAAHEAKRAKPRFEAARHADWSRVFKRKDVEHPGPPDRFQVLAGRDLGVAYAVYFIVYTKGGGLSRPYHDKVRQRCRAPSLLPLTANAAPRPNSVVMGSHPRGAAWIKMPRRRWIFRIADGLTRKSLILTTRRG